MHALAKGIVFRFAFIDDDFAEPWRKLPPGL
jgi:hypothetical protein